jgi:hypothetical protein
VCVFCCIIGWAFYFGLLSHVSHICLYQFVTFVYRCVTSVFMHIHVYMYVYICFLHVCMTQVQCLLEGGNAQFRAAISRLDGAALDFREVDFGCAGSVSRVYLSAAAEEYRSGLRARVTGLLRRPPSSSGLPPCAGGVEGQKPQEEEEEEEEGGARDSPRSAAQTSVWPWDHAASSSPPVSTGSIPPLHTEPSSSSTDRDRGSDWDLSPPPRHSRVSIDISFGAGALGVTLAKESRSGRAFVSRLVRGGAAHSAGAHVGDVVEVGINSFPFMMRSMPLRH